MMGKNKAELLIDRRNIATTLCIVKVFRESPEILDTKIQSDLINTGRFFIIGHLYSLYQQF
jgi:hypothetical protein